MFYVQSVKDTIGWELDHHHKKANAAKVLGSATNSSQALIQDYNPADPLTPMPFSNEIEVTALKNGITFFVAARKDCNAVVNFYGGMSNDLEKALLGTITLAGAAAGSLTLIQAWDTVEAVIASADEIIRLVAIKGLR